MIDLSKARAVLQDAQELIDDLDGLDIDDTAAVLEQGRTSPRVAASRQERAQASKDLLLLQDRLEMAASLVKSAYWVMKGEDDPLRESV